jgi:hypothetical protein
MAGRWIEEDEIIGIYLELMSSPKFIQKNK